jgi:hypothetical protein
MPKTGVPWVLVVTLNLAAAPIFPINALMDDPA